jgi:hypothetical protein
VATRSAGSSRRPSTAGKSRIGTARIAYDQAVANQVQTGLVPPSAKAGSTTLAVSRKMSGQLNVEDNTIAAAANATAPATSSPRSPGEAHGRRLPMPCPAGPRRDQYPRRRSGCGVLSCHASSQGPTVQHMRSGCGDQMETPRSATRFAASGSEQQDGWLGSQSG